MVTSLEHKQEVPAEIADILEGLQKKTAPREWRYAVPCAGVKYYAFRPVARDSVPVEDTEPRPIAAKLIDERVILL